MAGAISGAYLGVKAIPGDWASRIERSEYLIDLGDRLAEPTGLRSARQKSKLKSLSV